MRILIAEDNPASRNILKIVLSQWGYDVVVTCDGREAWGILQMDDAPQVAILDWEMPLISGLEVCKMAREHSKTTYIIMVTGREDQDCRVQGLQAGADDYIIKPWHKEELRARISVGIRIVDYKTKLASSNAELKNYACKMEKLAEEKSKQLIHAERMATVGMLSAGIAHEINNPTAFISGNAQTQQSFWKIIEPVLRKEVSKPHGNANKLEFILEEMPKAIDGIRNGVKRISSIVKGLKTFCRQEASERIPCNINSCIAESLTLCFNSLKSRVVVEQDLDKGIPEILADAQQIEQVLINLLINAADSVESHDIRAGKIKIMTRELESGVNITVEDNGHGIPPDKFEDIWQPFYTTKAIDRGTGLGLAISLGIIEEHGGKITAHNAEEGGAKFSIVLPFS